MSGEDKLRRVIQAWDQLPTGNYPASRIASWLVTDMKPAIDEAREALAATQEQRDPRSQSECYWDGWNDACDAVISTSYFKQLWTEMKRPRTDPLPSSKRDVQNG